MRDKKLGVDALAGKLCDVVVRAIGVEVSGGIAVDSDPRWQKLPAQLDSARLRVQALHERGVIDEQQYTEISAKAAAKQAEQAPGWWEKISVWGRLSRAL